MKLTEEVKKNITEILESDEFKNNLYEGLPQDKRELLGQFYTPANICIQMIEKFNCESLSGKNILDPTCGSGNLLIACLIAGADSDKIYGNDYDADAVKLCKKRINKCCEKLGKANIKDYQIHQGNALQKLCITDFSEEYNKNYLTEYIDDLSYAQGRNKWGKTITWAEANENIKLANQKIIQLPLF